jgi:hypothetical protein
LPREIIIVKSVAALLNTKGGTLVIGVEDNGNVFGLAEDYKISGNKGRDGFELWLMQTLLKDFGKDAAGQIEITFHELKAPDPGMTPSPAARNRQRRCLRRDSQAISKAQICGGERPGAVLHPHRQRQQCAQTVRDAHLLESPLARGPRGRARRISPAASPASSNSHATAPSRRAREGLAGAGPRRAEGIVNSKW